MGSGGETIRDNRKETGEGGGTEETEDTMET